MCANCCGGSAAAHGAMCTPTGGVLGAGGIVGGGGGGACGTGSCGGDAACDAADDAVPIGSCSFATAGVAAAELSDCRPRPRVDHG